MRATSPLITERNVCSECPELVGTYKYWHTYFLYNLCRMLESERNKHKSSNTTPSELQLGVSILIDLCHERIFCRKISFLDWLVTGNVSSIYLQKNRGDEPAICAPYSDRGFFFGSCTSRTGVSGAGRVNSIALLLPRFSRGWEGKYVFFSGWKTPHDKNHIMGLFRLRLTNVRLRFGHVSILAALDCGDGMQMSSAALLIICQLLPPLD